MTSVPPHGLARAGARSGDEADASRQGGNASVVVEAAWLTTDMLLLVLQVAGGNPGGADRLEVELDGTRSARELPTHSFAHAADDADVRDAVVEARAQLVVVSPAGGSQLRPDPSLSIRTGGRSHELTPGELRSATVDVKTLLRRWFTPLDARERNEVVDFLARAAMEAWPSVRTGRALLRVREALRERYPAQVNAPELTRGAIVEHLLKVDERAFFMKGWAYDEAGIVRLTAVSPEGMRVEVLERLFRYACPDVVEWSTTFSENPDGENIGMICFVELPAPSLLRGPWIIELENSEGTAVEVKAPSVQQGDSVVRNTILVDCSTTSGRIPDDELMTHHIVPAITRIQDRACSSPSIDSVTQHGTEPASPEVSLVVPLYRTIEYVEAQLAEFADDPEIRSSDLIYVLDSPELEDHLDYIATHLQPIYQVPFRVVVLKRNVGFANANNAGASVARGRLLLLLNSDVLPDQPGWLAKMRDFYDSTPNIGALAPKLMYEDDSIQHAGMHFYREPGSQLWVDGQYFKGLHRSFPDANVARPVPAVSGACMMIDKQLYEEFGGLSGQYVQGDYEDFDLCLRLLESGRENWYLPLAELYHLEAQSYTPELRSPSSRYNSWQHTHRWAGRIEELIQRYGSEADHGARVKREGAP